MCKATKVNFQIRDIYNPEPMQVLMELHDKDLLEGKIVDVSDSGGQEGSYAVVEIEGLSHPVIVAMRHLKKIGCQ
jgi:hypothetical protein